MKFEEPDGEYCYNFPLGEEGFVHFKLLTLKIMPATTASTTHRSRCVNEKQVRRGNWGRHVPQLDDPVSASRCENACRRVEKQKGLAV